MDNFNMKHRISIIDKGFTEDGLGQPIPYEFEFKKLWCDIKTVKGSEVFTAGTTINTFTYRFIIRYTTGIKPSMTIKFGTRSFTIKSILNDDEERKTMTIIGEEKV